MIGSTFTVTIRLAKFKRDVLEHRTPAGVSPLSEWLKTLTATFVGGMLALSSNIIIEYYFRSAQLRTQIQAELFRATYDKRIESYQAIVQMFSDAYWLEITSKSMDPSAQSKLRTEYMQKVQREIIRASPIIDQKVFTLALQAFNFYIERSNNFTPAVRTEWINLHVTSLVEAMRKDLHRDEIAQGVAEGVFQIAPLARPGR
jgi:hypothetical protein